MCQQETLALMQLSGTGASAGAQWQKSRYEESLARQNAILAERGAYRSAQAGADQHNALVRRGRAIEGSQRAAMGAAGIDPNVGQALALLEDDAYTNAADAQAALMNASRKSDALMDEFAMHKASARSSRKSRPVTLGSTLLTGAARAYGIYKG